MVMMLITKMMVTLVLNKKVMVMMVLTPRTRPTFYLASLPLARSSAT